MTDLRAAHGQSEYAVRLDWGPTGGAAVATGADVVVVVDVLSFTTAVAVAAERGIAVYPYPWRDEGAAPYAVERDAVLAAGRFEARTSTSVDQVTLSPASLSRARGLDRIVLPSPNGSSISFGLRNRGAEVVAAALRNRSAVARWLAPRLNAGATVALVPAGERWPDGSLRPCLEDLWGSGAVASALLAAGVPGLSPEAQAAATSYDAVAAGLGASMLDCAGGRELTAAGFRDDVVIGSRIDAASVVPVLRADAFLPDSP